MPSKRDLELRVASLGRLGTVTGKKLDDWVAWKENKNGRPVTPEEVAAMLGFASFLNLGNTIEQDLASENQKISDDIAYLCAAIDHSLAQIESNAGRRLEKSSREARVHRLLTLVGVQPPVPSGLEAVQAIRDRIVRLSSFFREQPSADQSPGPA